MAVDALSTWQTTFAALPKTKDTSWAANFATWADDRVTSKLTQDSGIQGPGLTFTFNKAIFQTALLLLLPVPDALLGIKGFADAWQTAMASSVAITAVGSSVGAPSPATTWSVVASTTIDPASIVLGHTKILELVNSPKVADALESEFPIKFREAFLLLTISTLGTNSVAPTPGPLNDLARAVQ